MVVIRLARSGAKKKPFYHVVVADQRSPRDGKYIQRVGYFNPVARGAAIRLQLDKERIQEWIGKGAQPSIRVGQLIVEFEQGPLAAEKTAGIRAKRAAKKAKPVVEAVAEEAPAEAPAAETSPEADA